MTTNTASDSTILSSGKPPFLYTCKYTTKPTTKHEINITTNVIFSIHITPGGQYFGIYNIVL